MEEVDKELEQKKELLKTELIDKNMNLKNLFNFALRKRKMEMIYHYGQYQN
jgi:hypothetical protein